MPRFSSLTRTSLLTGAAMLALTPAAAAGTITVNASGALVFTAAPGEVNRLSVGLEGDDSGRYRIADGPAISGETPPGCERPAWDSNGATLLCSPVPIIADLGDGDDQSTVRDAISDVTVMGGAGADWLDGSAGNDTIDGGPGEDRVRGYKGSDTLRGGEGNDDVDGGADGDSVDGGAGDDLIAGDSYEGQWADTIDGGPGLDRITADWGDRSYSYVQPPVTISLDDGPGDGRPGEGDDVRGVESIAVNIAGSYTGTDAAEEITVRQVLGATRLSGGGGNDTLKAPDGADTVDGGRGDDILDAGFGDDTLTPGPGRDTVYADTRGGDCGPAWCKEPYGNDTVLAADGEPDSISCGAGTDSVVADRIDTVASDCENVDRKAGVAVTPEPGTSQGPTVTPQKTTLRQAMARGVKLRISGATPGRKLKLTLKLRSRAVASGSAKASSQGNATVTVRFSQSGKRALRGRKQATFSVLCPGLGTTTLKLGAKP